MTEYKIITINNLKSQITFLIFNKKILLVYLGQRRKISIEQIKRVILGNENQFNLSKLRISGYKNFSSDNTRREKNFGGNFRFISYQTIQTSFGKRIIIKEEDTILKLEIWSYFELFNFSSVIRTWKSIVNKNNYSINLESVPSLLYSGLLQIDDPSSDFTVNQKISFSLNSSYAKLQWHSESLKDLGLVFRSDSNYLEKNGNEINFSNVSSLSCESLSSDALLKNLFTGQISAWQIETNSSWYYKLSAINKGNILNLILSGPNESNNGFWKRLRPRESFQTVKVAFTQINGKEEDVIYEMTSYRREIKKNNFGDQNLPVFFNNFMFYQENKGISEESLIKKASEIGCEYYILDYGLYLDFYKNKKKESSKFQFNFISLNLRRVVEEIKEYGMLPGLALDPQSIKANYQNAKFFPCSWFIMHHGKRWQENGLYHLDFRNSEVRKFSTNIFNWLIQKYGFGFLKFNCGLTSVIGTDYKADNFEEGLLECNRAYLNWLDGLVKIHPNLIIENSVNGGIVHDYATLSSFHLQNFTNQTQYLKNAAIATASPSVSTPEQCGIWTYCFKNNKEEIIYNMANSLLLRIQQTGDLTKLNAENLGLIKEGINIYKHYRLLIKGSQPIWPQGFPHIGDATFVYGEITRKYLLLGVWNNYGDKDLSVNLERYGSFKKIKQIYPQEKYLKIPVHLINNHLLLRFPANKMARIFRLSYL